MKKRRIIPVLIMMLAVAVSCSLGWAQQVGTSGQKRIGAIKIEGNKSISTITVLSKIKMKVGDGFEESALNKELKRLYATGYFGDVFVETIDQPEGVTVIFTVVEKPRIKEVKFSGNAKVKDKHLEKQIAVKEGTLLDFHIINQDVVKIRNYYTEQGYSSATVDYKINTDQYTDKITVVFVIDEGHPLRIKSIEVEGNINVSDNEIRKFMSTKTAWWFIRKGSFNEEEFAGDMDRIKTFYRSKGFLDVQVTSKEKYSDDGENMYLTIVINEGKKYLIGARVIKGELSFPEEEIRDIIKVRAGDPFDYQKIKEDLDNIRTFYYNKGYMDAEIDVRHKYNHQDDMMDLTYEIVSHDEIQVGKITILGNTKTKDIVIRRELRVYPGEKYDGNKLKKSKERIYNLGFFEDVYFETIPTDKKNVKDLNVSVKETKTGELSFGGGYSSVDAFIGFVQVRQRNFDISDFPTFTGGGQDLTIRGEMGSSRQNYLLSWTDPWIFGYPYLFGFDVYRNEHQKYGSSGYDYDETRTGGSLKLGKNLTDELSMGLVYNLEEIEISNVPSDSSQDFLDEMGTNLVSRLTLNTQYDTRDNKYTPTKGLVTGFSIENAGGFIGGDKDFLKFYSYTSFYHSLLDNVVLELKGRGGVAGAYGDTKETPVYERFYAGGARTIRGYSERSVGPRDSAGHSLGGDAMILGNAEVTFPIFKKMIKGAVFYDVGNVTADIGDIFGDFGYKQAAGLGVRVKTPIGPLKLDYGYPLSDNHEDAKEGQF
ncbi:MAG: outer membrane protein assembly factor BamA, partial [Candidatus Omnitrophica bacterium]|nr:outer membrane protein assembly factor BamA [Candidatus Omnitrophota bacterium]